MSGAELALGIAGLASTATIPLVAAAVARLRKSKYTFLDEREPVWRRFLEAWDSLSGTFEEIQHALPALERNPQGRHLVLREIEKATKVFADVNRHLVECKPLGKALAERERRGGRGSGMEETRKLVRGMREGEKGMRAALERGRGYVSGCEKCRCQRNVGEIEEQEWMRRKLEVMERNERRHRLAMDQARRDLYDLESAASSREELQMPRFLGATPRMEQLHQLQQFMNIDVDEGRHENRRRKASRNPTRRRDPSEIYAKRRPPPLLLGYTACAY